MSRIRRILVAIKNTDGRKSRAAARAAQLARGFGARLELFCAIDVPLYVDSLASRGPGLAQVKKQLETRRLAGLERMAKALRRGGLKVQVAVDWDYPSHEAIVRRALRTRANLIVLEAHPGRHVAPRLLQMADWEVLRLSSVPVLIVKRPRRYHRPVVLAAVDPTHQFAKPARLDEEILRRGSAVTRALRGTLHAVHAYMPLPRDMDPKTPWSKKNRAAAIEARAGVRARRAFDRCLRFSRIPRQRRHVVRRLPLEAVPAVARQTGSAIVVLGAISRSGLKGAIIGNTAESLLDDLRCDLLVVKPPRFARRVPRARRGMRFATSLPLVS